MLGFELVAGRLRIFPPAARGPVPPPACDRCGDPVDTLHYDGEALLCATCMRRIAGDKVAAADARPIRLAQPRFRLETK